MREGVLSSRVTVPSIRAAMSKLLKPDPELADTIYYKCIRLSNWYGLIPEIFPNTRYIYGIMTGSMEPYLKKLRHYSGELPLISADYGSSQGWIGANVNPELPPELVTYAILPNIGYFEFIPLKETLDGLEAKPVGLTEVKLGEEYEIVVTNFAAVEAAAQLLSNEKLEVVDFSSHVNTSADPGHYVIFWELSDEASEEILKECCNCLDKSFVYAGYVSSRKVNAVGALELRIVKRGTFHKILDHFVGSGAAVSQFKAPRCVGPTNLPVLQILTSNVVESCTSTAFS
ncbi:putative indole-3-acetic acid-amido synthetase GH3.5 [Capsicum chinense]|nr:putative indole-3-acetic acid-amido synthetase GH3.5 [Capsicum chinense]